MSSHWEWPHRMLTAYSMLPPTMDWPRVYARLLDACMGWVEPFMPQMAEQRGYRLTVCDIDPRGPLVEQQDIMSLTYKDGTFRGIISTDTLEHVSDMRQALRQFCRVTEPGGFLILGVPIEFSANGFRKQTEPAPPDDPNHHLWIPGCDILEMAFRVGYNHIGTVASFDSDRMHHSVTWLLEKRS